MEHNDKLLRSAKPIDYATNVEIDKVISEMVTIINNQYEILKKQEEAIQSIQVSSTQSSMYSRISIAIATIAVILSLILGLR